MLFFKIIKKFKLDLHFYINWCTMFKKTKKTREKQTR